MSVAVAEAGGAPRAIWRRGLLASRKGRWGFGILTALALIAIFAMGAVQTLGSTVSTVFWQSIASNF